MLVTSNLKAHVKNSTDSKYLSRKVNC